MTCNCTGACRQWPFGCGGSSVPDFVREDLFVRSLRASDDEIAARRRQLKEIVAEAVAEVRRRGIARKHFRP